MNKVIKQMSVISMVLMLSACGGVFNKQAKYNERQQTYGNMALYYLQNDQLNQAQHYLKLAKKEKMHSLKLTHATALLAARQGQFNQAQAAFKSAVNMADSANQQVKNMIMRDYASFLCANNEADKGLQMLAALEKEQNAQEQLVIGQCYVSADDTQKAQAYFRRSLQSIESPQALFAMADMAYKKNEYLQARAFLERYFLTGAMTDAALKMAANVEAQLNNNEKQAQYEALISQSVSTSNLF